MIFVLFTSFHDALYLYQNLRKYLEWCQSYLADMICIPKFKKGHNSVKCKNCRWNFGICPVTLSDNALYVYQVSRTYLEGFQRNRPEHESQR